MARRTCMDIDFTQIVNEYSFRKFFDAWTQAREGDAVPTRKAISLRDFAPFVSDLLIYELPAPDNLCCRLMGEHVSDRVKIYNRDINWLDLVADDMRAAGIKWWRNLFQTPCAGLMQFSTGFLNGTNRITRAYLLPIQHAPDVVHMLGLATASDVFEAGEPRDSLIISDDCFQTKYVDIGFGLPKNAPEAQDHKLLAKIYSDRIFAG